MSRIQAGTCYLRATCLCLLAVVFSGCAGMQLPDTSVPDIAPERHTRADQAAAEFEARRAFAEYQAALNYWQRNDVKGCLQTLDRLLERSPDHLEARLLAAEVCLELGHHPQAMEHLAAAETGHPDDPRVHHATGLALDAMRRPNEALARYKRAMELAPDEEVFAVSYHAATQTAANLQAPPLAPPLTDDTGLALATDEPNPVTASEPADRADSDDVESSRSPEALAQRGAQALQQGLPDAALAYYSKAMRQQPDNLQLAITAAVQSLQANYPELAVELLSPLAGDFPQSARLRQVLGTAFYRLGDYRSSQVTLQQALSLDKQSALTYFLMGCTLAKLGQQDSAAAHMRQARTLDPRFAATR